MVSTEKSNGSPVAKKNSEELDIEKLISRIKRLYSGDELETRKVVGKYITEHEDATFAQAFNAMAKRRGVGKNHCSGKEPGTLCKGLNIKSNNRRRFRI